MPKWETFEKRDPFLKEFAKLFIDVRVSKINP
jgi:hypothetical protein